MRGLLVLAAVVVALLTPAAAQGNLLTEDLNGSNNNLRHPNWGAAGTDYLRVAPPVYSDGVGAPQGGPPARYISNRVFNDLGQNIFSEQNTSQWGWSWGQFIDHDIGLRDESAGDPFDIATPASDPLESFNTDFPSPFTRTNAAPGTGTSTDNPRQQVNTLTSYIDASQVYGSGQPGRLGFLRAPNSPDLLLPGGYLPTAADNPGVTAPPMDLMGQLQAHPGEAVIAGDVRANENIALTANQTLFAREHNRIADGLPRWLGNEARFQIARRVVSAEVQFITYNEFLPALGVELPSYRGYDPGVNATLGNEFATTGYRAHSQVHGVFDLSGAYSAEQLDAFRAEGIDVGDTDPATGETAITVPLNVAFGNPDLLRAVGEDNFLQHLGDERQYRNDEQIDNSLRSVLFQVPAPGVDPADCSAEVVDPNCFTGLQDLGAIDVQRARDHGIPRYNDLRRAYGLPPARSFWQVTGEARVRGAVDPNDPGIIAFTSCEDADGNPVDVGNQEDAVSCTRATPLAARLKAIYGTPDAMDGFVGMMSEPHLPGSDLGALQSAIWTRQFAALRDGDRFFYANDPLLALIRRAFGVDYRVTLSQVIAANTDAAPAADVFKASGD